ncbi:hypothetical protein FRX31_031694 [Thalictrum thalictroides]|uniref:Uncharacterized protein n=1 Tax=Thalictrum thalictroides TaxID=46969 RepID=A0A7J6V166_THATH|nr:hypothetical protein FRX31_031694 [Thalictrum thalictroides]
MVVMSKQQIPQRNRRERELLEKIKKMQVRNILMWPSHGRLEILLADGVMVGVEGESLITDPDDGQAAIRLYAADRGEGTADSMDT